MKKNAFYKQALAVVIGTLISGALGAASIFDADEVVDLYQAGAQVRFQGFDITSLPDDRFAATWVEHNIETDLDRVRLARFDQNGHIVGDILTVSENSAYPDFGLSEPMVDASGSGGLVVVWGGGSKMDSSDCRTNVMLGRVGIDDSVSSPWLASPGYGYSCNPDLSVNQDGWSLVAMSYDIGHGYVYQLSVPEGGGGGHFLLGSDTNLDIPVAVAIQEGSGQIIWPVIKDGDTVLMVMRYSYFGSEPPREPWALDAGIGEGERLYQTFPVLAAGSDGGYASAWFQSATVNTQKVFSQRIQYINADGSAGASATIGEDSLDVLSGKPDMAGDRNGTFLIGWTVLENGEPRYRKVTAFDEEGVIDTPAVIVSKGAPGLFDASANTRVALNADLAVAAWYEQADGNSGPVLKARIGSAPKRSDVGQGSGGGGGSTGPVLFLGLALLALRRQLTYKQTIRHDSELKGYST
ncbi:hypothetical protein A6D6_00636 [Alcanivorax xiamenensis]|uniref:GlyGly-CTERM domain-containing protein n=1 Tax=Alcanivorax xiamenensis TaxID=1177156 RepID=A0ABQ6YCV3_9GAMM|nr:hypothetical protein [Alcanivorax xiamenensis]KAF0807639.1 hypothetical protein A6D6_00636 [Alcanivorax xiamenensis]